MGEVPNSRQRDGENSARGSPGVACPTLPGQTRQPGRNRRPQGEGNYIVAVSVNLEKALDKAWEDKSLDEILAAPPSALAGLTPAHDELLAQLRIKTVADMGSNKYFALANALVALSGSTG